MMENPTKRMRTCSICLKTFKRTEHCVRHERAHKRERPFPCRFCERAYGRKDLLVRHEKTLHADAWAKAQETLESATDKSKRPVRRRQKRAISPTDKENRFPHNMAQEIPSSTYPVKQPTTDFMSFLPSPLKSSLSDEGENIGGNCEPAALDFAFPLTPSFRDHANLLPNGEAAQSYQMHHIHLQGHSISPPFDESSIDYGSPVQLESLSSFQSHDNFPLDPDLPKASHGLHGLLSQQTAPDEVDFFSLIPCTNLDLTCALPFDNVMSNQKSGTEFMAFPERTPRLETDSVDKEGSQNSPRDYPTGTTGSTEHFDRQNTRRSSLRGNRLLSETTRQALIDDLKTRLGRSDFEIEIPSEQALQRFLKQFFQSFNRHLPIFHFHSFDVNQTHSPLVLAMCSIGALYHLERPTAERLRILADEALTKSPFYNSTISPSLWEVQCKLLIIAEAAFGGNCTAVSLALGNVGFFHRVYSSWRTRLFASRAERDKTSWSEWIERETAKRLLFGIFIISSLLTIAYNIAPCVSTTDDLKIEMPEDERLWNAGSEEEWLSLISTQDRKSPSLSMNQALTKLMFGEKYELTRGFRWPAFATTVIMHAVNVHMWQLTQTTHSFMNFAIDPVIEEQMRTLCTAQTEEALARCHRLLTQDCGTESSSSWEEADSLSVFTSLALLRSCYVRVFTGSGSFNRSMLFSENDDDIIQAARDYIQTPQVRTPFLSRAIGQVFAALLTPVRAGHLLVRKTAAFTWSIEHAIAAWDCALFYTKWVHTMEIQEPFAPPDDVENQNLSDLMQLLNNIRQQEGNDGEHSEGESLAAAAARTWATFLDDTWVWEVTWRMGTVLRRLGDVYEEDKRKAFAI